MGNLDYDNVKGSINLSITLNKLVIIVPKSKKLLELGNTGGFKPLSTCINPTLLHMYT